MKFAERIAEVRKSALDLPDRMSYKHDFIFLLTALEECVRALKYYAENSDHPVRISGNSARQTLERLEKIVGD